MKPTLLAALVVGVGVLAFAAGVAFTEDEVEPKPLGRAELEAEVMKRGMQWQGPEHERLAAMAGAWAGEGHAIVSGLGRVPVRGTVTMTPMWGGRYLRSHWEGPGMAPGTKLQGEGITGYNRLAGRYESTWMMSMWTHMQLWHGTYDADKRCFTYTTDMDMPDGTTWPMRRVVQLEGDDRMVEQQFTGRRGEKQALVFEMTYTREAETAAK